MIRIFILLAVFTSLLTACSGANQTTDASSAPAFDLPNALGGNVSLKDYEGRNVLLFFHMAVG